MLVICSIKGTFSSNKNVYANEKQTTETKNKSLNKFLIFCLILYAAKLQISFDPCKALKEIVMVDKTILLITDFLSILSSHKEHFDAVIGVEAIF